jgi:Transposase DDE domain
MRRIATTGEVVPHLAWPGLAQVCRIERTRQIRGQTSREVVYAVTSLSRMRAGPADLLALTRKHWTIENQLHWPRDVILREDASRVRSGAAPRALAVRATPSCASYDTSPDPSPPSARPSPRTACALSPSPPMAFMEWPAPSSRGLKLS